MAEPPSLSHRLRALTPARVALGRAGNALPTRALLDFALAHARARDAVHAALGPIDFDGRETIAVRSRAPDRAVYLARPDLGRLLAEEDADRLAGGQDLAIVAADGLSAVAVERHAPPLVAALVARLGDWSVAPIVVARQARVAIGDEVGAALDVRAVVVLIGERPGLSAPDSLGAYITWEPRRGQRDSERNCVSNIRPPQGLGYNEAADRIAALLRAARATGCTGVQLKPPEDQPRIA